MSKDGVIGLTLKIDLSKEEILPSDINQYQITSNDTEKGLRFLGLSKRLGNFKTEVLGMLNTIGKLINYVNTK